MGLSAHFGGIDYGRHYDAWLAANERKIGRAMLRTTRIGADRLQNRLREDIRSAGLGNLGNALKASSDDQRGNGVHLLPNGFSASGIVVVRSRSDRTRGALAAYTAGADIRPRKGPWLWYPSDDLQRFVGSGKNRRRLTPGTWESSGMRAKLGPLIPLRSVDGKPLLAVEMIGTSLAGARRSAKPLTKRGTARKGQRVRQILVVFIAIPWTSRRARVSPRAIHRSVMAELPAIYETELRKG